MCKSASTWQAGAPPASLDRSSTCADRSGRGIWYARGAGCAHVRLRRPHALLQSILLIPAQGARPGGGDGRMGFDQFFVAGHDRGARTAYRMALDHPEKVRKFASIDTLPTHYLWTHVSREWALNSFHWTFM